VVIWYIFPVLVFCTKKNLAIEVVRLSSEKIIDFLGQSLQYFLGETTKAALSGKCESVSSSGSATQFSATFNQTLQLSLAGTQVCM
jgi:hypothetical protein